MGKNKLMRYHQIQALQNIIDFSHYKPNIQYDYKGEWSSFHFSNQQPIILELACGKGDYALALAERYPDKNIIGVDIKGERLWHGANKALKSGLTNLMFIRGYIDHITNMFGDEEVDEIWITFPDPYLKDRKTEKRLTHPVFLSRFRKIMKQGGVIHLKTDSPELFAFTLEVIEENKLTLHEVIEDVYALPQIPEILKVQTYYEKKHLQNGRTIRYLRFSI